LISSGLAHGKPVEVEINFQLEFHGDEWCPELVEGNASKGKS
jgi:hypothetical protein